MTTSALSCARWLLWLLCSSVVGQVAATEVFKWRDAEGQVHFGDHAPPANAESLTIRASPPSAAKDNDSGNRQEHLRQVLEGYTKEREAREAARAAEKQATEQHELMCAAAKKQQYELEHANFLFDYTDKGERRVLEGAEYDGVIARARKRTADSCD